MGRQLRRAPPRAAATVYNFAAVSDLPVAEDGDGEWLLSFADIITLLLTLFVVLLAVSHFHLEGTATAPATNAQRMVKRAPATPVQSAEPRPFPDPDLFSFNGTLPLPAVPEPPAAPVAARTTPQTAPAEKPQPPAKAAPAHPAQPEPFPDPDLFSFSGALPLPVAPLAPAADAARKAARAAEPPTPAFTVPDDIRDQVEVARSAQSVNLIIKDDLLYPTGSADLSAAGKRILDRIAELLQQDGYPVSVEGYTDNTPIHTARFPSNWELSAARATNVTRYLIARGVAPGRLSAVGYGDTRPRAANTTAAGRARNRRVSLVIHLPARRKGTPRAADAP